MNQVFKNLLWLPTPPDDFSIKLDGARLGSDLQELARYRVDENQIRRLSNKLQALRGESADLSPLIPITVGIISNATTKLISPALTGVALRFGLSLTVAEAGYNQVVQEAFSSETPFGGAKPKFILLAIDYRGLPLMAVPGDLAAAKKNVKECLEYVKSVIDSLRARTGAQIILQNIAPPSEGLSGSYEGRLPGTLSWLCSRLNLEFDELASQDVFILDIAGLASNVGLENWNDPTQWNIAKLPFSQEYTSIYADFFCRILSARLGKSRRCLVLDLDNTIWGGVIGDDGVEGILIGNGDPTGEAHLHVQQTALELRNRGVVLAVSSKNEDVVARKPFLEHPDMLLRENHIAVFQANWADKASNIRAIAETLSFM
jgi:HAD superfamily phosphatase (TIGR01681 family)